MTPQEDPLLATTISGYLTIATQIIIISHVFLKVLTVKDLTNILRANKVTGLLLEQQKTINLKFRNMKYTM